MAVAVQPLSAAEYLATPESRPQHTELINGMVVVNEPHLPHMHAQRAVFFALMAWERAAPGRGLVALPADVRINDGSVFAPDVWWMGEERRPAPDALVLNALPDLVVEVRSPSNWARDLAVKLPAYEEAGVAEAWFVDAEARTVLIFRRSVPQAPTFDIITEVGTDEALTSPMLPDFSPTVGEIFER